ncbi:MAG: hypothetical protein KGI63_09630, partial [Xanthomonadaceae bacterium]|nr:hypothetical protein [Xanthomonadaceae bacterium]
VNVPPAFTRKRSWTIAADKLITAATWEGRRRRFRQTYDADNTAGLQGNRSHWPSQKPGKHGCAARGRMTRRSRHFAAALKHGTLVQLPLD